MPFYGYTGIPMPDKPDKTVGGVLIEWRVAKDEYVEADHVLAKVQIGQDVFSVKICFPALIIALCAVTGQRVTDTDYILKWAADGENIPYGRTYFETVKEDT